MLERLKTASLALAISAIVAACATTTSPTGRTQVVGGVSQEELNQLGTQAFNEVKAQKRPTTDARQQREAQCIVSAITRQLPPNWQGMIRRSRSADRLVVVWANTHSSGEAGGLR